MNRVAAKASAPVKVGYGVEAFTDRERIVEVAAIIDERVGAPVAATCLIDRSPPAPATRREPRAFVREPGAGRPTKRDRLDLDRLRRP